MVRKTNRSKDHVKEEVVAAVRASQSASEALDHAAADHLGINRTDGRIMDLLDQAEGRMTAGELAHAAAMSSAAITAAVDRLEQAGYVHRVRDGMDRRRVFIELDPGLLEGGRGVYDELARDGDILLSKYTIAELELIRDFLRAGTEMNLRHARRLRDR